MTRRATLQGELFDISDATGALLTEMLSAARRVFVKTLSNNDRDWAQRHNMHQDGVCIPPAQRDGGFFPPLNSSFFASRTILINGSLAPIAIAFAEPHRHLALVWQPLG